MTDERLSSLMAQSTERERWQLGKRWYCSKVEYAINERNPGFMFFEVSTNVW